MSMESVDKNLHIQCYSIKHRGQKKMADLIYIYNSLGVEISVFKGSLQQQQKNKKREIVWGFFYQRGGVPPPQSLVEFPVFSSEKTGNPLNVWFFIVGGGGGGYPPRVW
jgi:hypothetical protein